MRALVLLLVVSLAPALRAETRAFEFSYQVMAGNLPTGEAVDIYLPLPAEHAGQQVVASSLESNLVITSYSIHYTKLYEKRRWSRPVERRVHAVTVPARRCRRTRAWCC